MRRRLSIAALSLLSSIYQGAAQQPQPASGTIAGALRSADLGGPVRRAAVKLVSAQPAATRTATTDADGRFAFTNLPPGDYTLSASKAGFLESVFGARRPGAGVAGTPIRLAAGERRDDIAMRLPRGGVISGIVTDEFGDAALGVPVRAMRLGYANGQRVAQPIANAATDDLGAYRLAGLPPGEYIVSAVPRDSVAARASMAESLRARSAAIAAAGRTPPPSVRSDEGAHDDRGYVPVYFSGTASPSAATRVTLGVSQQVAGVDIQLQALKTATIAGTIANPDGTPGSANVQLIDAAMPIANLGVWFRNATPGGKFSFAGLAPGAYVLSAQAPSRGAAGGSLTGSLTVTVDAEPVEVALTLSRGVSVSGAIRLDPLKGAGDLRRIRVRLAPIATASDWEMAPYEDMPDAQGRFTFRGVAPGRYRVTVIGLPSGWTLESAVFGNLDAADVHLSVAAGDDVDGGVLRVTARTGEIAGALSTADGAPASDRTVILFPADRAHWMPQSRRIHVVQPAQDGRYSVRELPAGEYRVAAVDGVEAGEQFDPGFLARIAPDAQSVNVAAGALATADIRVR